MDFELLSPSNNKSWYGDLPIISRYTFGIAGEKFFREIKENARFWGTRCPKCEHIYIPPTIFCERCLNELDDWVDVGTVGILHTFTVLHLDYSGKWLPEPEIIGFIKIADGGLIHRLLDVKINSLSIGMNVAAIFKPHQERIGAITDIMGFLPL